MASQTKYLAIFVDKFVHNTKVMPLCLPGTLTSANRNAIDWHSNGLLAYASQNTLVLVDVNTLKAFQTLTKHYAAITRICWQPSKNFSGPDQTLKCASADSSGHIIVWNVISGRVVAKFFSQNHAIHDMKWLEFGDSSCDFLLVLHSKTLLILWNANSNEPVWQSRLSFNAFSFSLDPFNSNNIAFSSNGSSLAFLHAKKTESNPGFINLRPHRLPNFQPTLLALYETDKHADCLIQQVVYHRAYPDLVFAVLKDQLFCVNSAMKQIVYNVYLSYPIQMLLPCSDRDAFYIVQTNGVVSLNVATFKQNTTSELPSIELAYEKACSTEILRGSSKVSVAASALCPVYETHVALLYNNGKLIFYQLQSDVFQSQNYRLHSIADHIHLNESLDQTYSSLKLRQVYQLNSLTANVTVMRMRPMNAIDDSLFELGALQLAAVATASGIIHLVDVFTCRIVRSFQVNSSSIKCMEWSGNLLISASSSSSLSSSSTVKNEIFACDMQTGQKQRIRPEADESSIEMLRVSTSNRYLALVFRHDPLEIWDLQSMRMLRRMSKKCPIIVDMVWFGKPKKNDESENVCRENLVILDVDNRLYHVVIKGIHVRDGKEVNTEWKNSATILKVAYKQDLLVFGDSTGRIRVWDLLKKQSRQTNAAQSNRGPVVRLAFTSLAGDTTIAVQHASSIAIWDVDNLQLIQLIGFPGLNIIDSDMCGVTPVYVLSDGALRYSTSNNELCAPVPENEIPLLLNEAYQKDVLKFAQTQTERPDEYKTYGESLNSIFSRIASIDKIGDRLDVAYTFLGQTLSADLIKIADALTNKKTLPCRLWMFWPRKAFRQRLEKGTKTLMKRCKTTQHVELITEKAIVLGQRDWATYLLLNFEHEIGEVGETRLNAFKACLLAADLNGEEAQCLVKLTATNLIASGFISDGVQLLYLINQPTDACRYLASQGDWSRSFSYSKLLPNNEGQEIFTKFTQHLASNDSSKSLIVLLHASFGDWNKCIQLLNDVHQQDVAKNLQRVLDDTSTNAII